jgi:sec-independent protein translocase protein TatC
MADELPGGEQPLLAHLIELRQRLLSAMTGVAIAFLPLAFYAKKIYHFLAEPLLKLLPPGSSMIATEVASPFFAPFKLAGLLAFALALPWVLYQIWAFVAPGLYRNEKRLVGPLLASSTLLFYAGVSFAYFIVLPRIFEFLLSVTPEGVSMMTDISKYLDFVLKLFVAFGLAFETPVAIVLLCWTGFLTPQQLRSHRDYVLVGIFFVAAILTPPDVISQVSLALSTYALYELGILWASWLVRNKSVRAADDSANI